MKLHKEGYKSLRNELIILVVLIFFAYASNNQVIDILVLIILFIFFISLYFFRIPKRTFKRTQDAVYAPCDGKVVVIEKTSETPSIEVKEKISKISRVEAINQSKRISFENENIKGSISLKGGVIDDLTFKKYTKTLNGNDYIT